MSNNQSNQEIVSTEKKVDKKRRSVTKASGAVPVLMMLGQRPAFGAFCTVSGFISATPGAVSSQRHQVDSCGGLSPGAWKYPYAGSADWSLTSATPGGEPQALRPERKGQRGVYGDADYGTTLGEFFGFNGFMADESLYDCFWMTRGLDPKQFGAHIAAAGLNAAAGLYTSVAGLTTENVKNMYEQVSIKGSFEPSPGIIWTIEELVTFIKQTFH